MLREIWRRWSLQARLLLSILLVLALTISASGLLFYLSSVATIERATSTLTANNASQMVRSVDLYIEHIGRLSRSIYGDASVQRALRASDTTSDVSELFDESEVSYRLLTVATSWPSIRGIYLYANNGALFYFTRGQLPRRQMSASDEPWITRMRQQAAPPTLLWPTAAETTVIERGAPVFSYIRLIKNSDTGRRIGYLKIDIDVVVMQDLLALSQGASQGRQVLLLDDAGHVIYDSRAALTGGQINDLRLVGQELAQGRMDWQKHAYLYTAQRSAATGWTVWLLTPIELLSTETQSTGMLVVLLCIAAMLLLGTLVYIVTRRITQPLKHMARAMACVEQGDLSVRVPETNATHELGRLSRVFNTMLDSLERLLTQVYEAQLRTKDAQLLALQSQINPHFLFNTLNSMRALGRRGQAATVANMAESLADLFRYSMSNWNELVPLREELVHIENYVRIQQARFGERIQYVCAIPAELQDALVVKLSLQPLVENAISHGLDRQLHTLEIRMCASEQDQELSITVTDNAGGIDPTMLTRIRAALDQSLVAHQLPTSDVGIGIANIDRRIKLLFGEYYGLRFQVIPKQGTTVTLHIPLQRRSADIEEIGDAYAYSRR